MGQELILNRKLAAPLKLQPTVFGPALLDFAQRVRNVAKASQSRGFFAV